MYLFLKPAQELARIAIWPGIFISVRICEHTEPTLTLSHLQDLILHLQVCYFYFKNLSLPL